MVRQLAYATCFLALCVLIHAVGTIVMARIYRLRDPGSAKVRRHRPLLQLCAGFVLVFSLHILETVVWAGAYVSLGAIATLEEALYFSIVSFTTVGYGDVVLSSDWRILGACEAVTGTLMFGWSVGLLVILVQRVTKQLA
jgi:voltage-gated potassium channel Kch